MALTKIGTSGIKDDAVTSAKVANDTIATADIADDAVTEVKIVNGAVTQGKLGNNAVTTNKIAVDAITNSHLSNNSVNTAEIYDEAITLAKLEHGTSSNDGKFLRANNGADPTFETVSTGPGRNLIINGAMNVAQRGTSSTTSGYGSVDRFDVEYGGTDESPTQAQVDVASGTTPYTLGFRKALKITNGNQTSGTQGSDYIRFSTKLEAQDIANSGWNYTSSSSYITLSFWIKSSVAQNFYFRAQAIDGTSQAYTMETGSLSADTWTKITKTIPGNSNLTFDNNNGEGFLIRFSAFIGTDSTGTRPLNAWAAYNGSTRYPDNTSTWYTTNDATLEVTGFQLEVGSVATDFEHMTYADEIIRCERYYRRDSADGVAYYRFAQGQCTSATGTQYVVKWPTRMRAAPTYAVSGTITIYSTNIQYSSSSHALLDQTTQGGIITANAPSGLGAGNCADLIAANDGNAYIEFIAEL